MRNVEAGLGRGEGGSERIREAWGREGGVKVELKPMPDDCLADDTTTDTTDSGDSPDRTTAASGGTLSESDGAQALVAGALAPLAALLL